MNLENVIDNSELFEEIAERVDLDGADPALESMAPGLGSRVREMTKSWSPESAGDDDLEAIVRFYGRPVLFIRNGQIAAPVLKYWQAKLAPCRDKLEGVIPSVGRIEVENHPRLPWVGTGWLVADDIVATNRHVAVEFGRRSGDGFEFRQNHTGRRMKARIDTLEEHDNGAEQEYRIREILHIEDEDGPDVAFLKVSRESDVGDPLPGPIALSASDPTDSQVVGVVGYAASDARRNPGTAMPRIFERIYNVKRLHPGEVMSARDDKPYFTHDCSTLGGNSGSAVLDFVTGEAVGLHFAGSFLEGNYAVKASVVRELLESKLGVRH